LIYNNLQEIKQNYTPYIIAFTFGKLAFTYLAAKHLISNATDIYYRHANFQGTGIISEVRTNEKILKNTRQ
jgi:hypothetical protein